MGGGSGVERGYVEDWDVGSCGGVGVSVFGLDVCGGCLVTGERIGDGSDVFLERTTFEIIRGWVD